MKISKWMWQIHGGSLLLFCCAGAPALEAAAPEIAKKPSKTEHPKPWDPLAFQTQQTVPLEKLKWNFQNIEVRALLQTMAEMAQLNLVIADGVTGQVSLHLKDMTWPQALEVVLEAKSLSARQSAGALWVAPKDEWTGREKQALEAQSQLHNAAPLQAFALPLKYAKALDVAQRLQAGSAASAGGGHKWLSSRGSVMAEPRTNQLFVLDTPAFVQQIQRVVAWLDVPVRQVMIEARIVEADEKFGKSLGLRLGGAFSAPFSSNAKPLTASAGALSAGTTAASLPGNLLNLPAGAAGQTMYAPASFAVSLFNAAADKFLSLEISALEADGKGRVVASPRVVTADQTKALIEQGTELPYQVASASGATSVSFRKANLKLEVTPQITPEGAVVLELDITKDSVGQTTPAGYAINSKHVKTQVLVDNGGTVVIGGILETAETQEITQVPGLSALPGLGWLFENRQTLKRKTELLVFVTPRVLAQTVSSAASNTLGGSFIP